MKQSRRQFLHMATGATSVAAMLPGAWAQTYPARPITLIIPFPPAGATDVAARVLSDGMRASLRQPIVIENIGGANGSIGVGRAARAAPDGYTVVLGNWNTFVANGAVYALPYNLWGPDGWRDMLRRTGRCTKCGKRGVELQHPSWDHAYFLLMHNLFLRIW